MQKEIIIVIGDIVNQKTDAIVNAANSTLLGGGGVDGAIHKAAGSKLLEECRKLDGCPTGFAKISKGYQLAASYIIHTVGPVYYDGLHQEPELLAKCYENSMRLGDSYTINSISFPSISTGAYRYPIRMAAPIAISTVLFCLSQSNSIQSVTFVLFKHSDYTVYFESCTKKNNEFEKNNCIFISE